MSQPNSDRNTELNVGAYYDHFMYDAIIDEFYDHSDFHNFGLWRSGVPSAEAASRTLVTELTDLVAEPPTRILEVGCGKGATTREICKRWARAEVTGIDVSVRQLATCRRNCPSATFLRMDACELDFPDATFDLIVSIEAAFHFRSRREFLEQALLKLRPSGQIVLQDVLHRKQATRGDSLGLDAASVLSAANYLDGPDDYERLLVDAGFRHPRIMDVTDVGPHAFYAEFLRYLRDRRLKSRYDDDHLRQLRVGVRLFARDLEYCLLVCADRPAA